MPLNTLRLNHAPSSHPNDRIVFIKPLPRPASEQQDYETADLLLRAIAAQCLPIMKSNYLSVTTLEEYEPNPEFIGRNFNNGEVIQLVLRSKSGAWLSVRMIQMVMMHELAHNEQMNHSRKFWEVRNKFADEMKSLWARGYTGDGLWGSGRVLGDLDGQMRQGNGVIASEELKDLPLCGGTFRSRGRRRKRKVNSNTQNLTWKQKKERRIEKKFGKNGVALGEDEDKRLMLEGLGKGPMGVKPRVAQSKRGRELRAAAALARFDTNKREVDNLEKSAKDAESSSEAEDDDYEDIENDQEDAHDIHGKRLLDSNGRGMIRVCGDENEDENDIAIKHELDELEGLALDEIRSANDLESRASLSKATSLKPQSTTSSHRPNPEKQNPSAQKSPTMQNKQEPSPVIITPTTSTPTLQPPSAITTRRSPPITLQCPICTAYNPKSAITCTICEQVLDKCKDPHHWRCQSETCSKAGFERLNAGDCGICGLCGERKPATT